jgi:multiple sugar transport system substrate-binding protein
LVTRLPNNLLGSTVTLTYWGLWEPDSVMRPILDEFEAAHPKIKVQYVKQSPQEYRERLQSSLSQGKGPDIFRIHNTWVPMFSQFLSPVPSSVYSTSDYDKFFYPTTRKDLISGSNYVAVPLMIDGLGMYVNNDLFKQAGISIPKNWDDLRTAALVMSKCRSESGACLNNSLVEVSGIAMGSTENVDHWQDIIAVLMLQNNVNLNKPDSPSPTAAEDVISYFNSFNKTYHIWNPNLPSSTTQFINGKLAIYFAPSWRVFEIMQANPNLNFEIYPIPQVPIDPVRNEKPITWASYWAEAVNSKTKNSAQSWELLKYLSSPEVLTKLYEKAVSSPRQFGEPYSRTDMAGLIQDSKYVGPYITQAPSAVSWYIASQTYDGQTGINSKLSTAFASALSKGTSVQALSQEINKILSQYGIVAAAP